MISIKYGFEVNLGLFFKSIDMYQMSIMPVEFLFDKYPNELIVYSEFTSDPYLYLLKNLIESKNLVLLKYWLKDKRVTSKINERDNKGENALDYAKKTNNKTIIKLIKKYM